MAEVQLAPESEAPRAHGEQLLTESHTAGPTNSAIAEVMRAMGAELDALRPTAPRPQETCHTRCGRWGAPATSVKSLLRDQEDRRVVRQTRRAVARRKPRTLCPHFFFSNFCREGKVSQNLVQPARVPQTVRDLSHWCWLVGITCPLALFLCTQKGCREFPSLKPPVSVRIKGAASEPLDSPHKNGQKSLGRFLG